MALWFVALLPVFVLAYEEPVPLEVTGNTNWEEILATLDVQYEAWKANEFDQYVYSQRVDCFCLPCFIATKYVTVSSDEVLQIEFASDTDECGEDDLVEVNYRTIDEWFDAAIEYANSYADKCPYTGTKVGDFCGGIGAIQCDEGFLCVDDPNDECDPSAGGADCGGVCVLEGDECENDDESSCDLGWQCDTDLGVCIPEDSFFDPCKDKSLDITYDETYGYPTSIIFDIAARAYDGGASWYFECMDAYQNGVIIDAAAQTCDDYTGEFSGDIVNTMACTEDAMVCDDGTVLSRDPDLDCEFPPCPVLMSSTLDASDECGCEDEAYDPYCCRGVQYDNICEAECDGVNKPEKKCDKGECSGYARSVGLMGLMDDNKDGEEWSVEDKHGFRTIAFEILILSIMCFSAGLSISFCFRPDRKAIAKK